MHDTIQQAVEGLALHNTVARVALILCGGALIYLVGLAWLVVAGRQWRRATLRTAARLIVLGVLVVLGSKVLTHVIIDPRPYIVTHTRPLIPTSHDNGFPSDHTLLAAALTASLWWLDRRWLGVFALGTLLVLLGRLGVGAHHTLDVVGSLSIAAVAALVSRAVPLPATWRRPVLPVQGRVSDVMARPGARRDSLT